MNFKKFLLPLVFLAAISWATAQETGATWPTRPVTLIVPASAGGPGDTIARYLAQHLSLALKQPVVVENKPGASQIIGTDFVAKAKPDGYTLLMAPSTAIVVNPYTIKNLPYSVERDLVIVAQVATTPVLLCAHPSLPANSVEELLAYGKANPTGLNYGTWGNGSLGHLLGEYLSRKTGISLLHVPYKGVAPVMQDLVAGNLTLGMADAGTPGPFIKSGKLKALAVAGSARSRNYPNVPTFAEQGIAGMEPFQAWQGLFSPAETPRPIVDRLAAEVTRIVATPEFRDRVSAFGYEPTGLGPQQAAAIERAESRHWQKIVADLPGVKFD